MVLDDSMIRHCEINNDPPKWGIIFSEDLKQNERMLRQGWAAIPSDIRPGYEWVMHPATWDVFIPPELRSVEGHKRFIFDNPVVFDIEKSSDRVVFRKRIPMPDVFITKDSGQREEWSTGSRRDTREGKGRFDLISPIGLTRLAQLYERGAVKYGDRNWEKGQPLSRYLDSALRHTVALVQGMKDEDHAAAVAWNMFSFMHTSEMIVQGKLPKELDDLSWTEDVSEKQLKSLMLSTRSTEKN